jgi:dimethylhistidine N-methyltransferase
MNGPPLLAAATGLFAAAPNLPPWLFYDERGSELFEEITRLPEYYLTRAERYILEAHADDILQLAASDHPTQVIEFGAGSATKSQILLEALVRRQGPTLYLPVDVSGSALDGATERLRREAPQVELRPIRGTHTDALPALRALGPNRLVLFLGSSIGNFEDPAAIEFLSQIAAVLPPGGALLLGTDRAKDPARLLPAYDDAAGVTAAFNRNLLVRLNRELETDFDLSAWRHEARWNRARSRIEMHLVSERAQQVRVPGLGAATFGCGDSIHTESSHKYDEAHVDRLLHAAGFSRVSTFTDPEGLFDLHLALRVASLD